MLVGRKDGVMLILSSIGLVRCHVTPRVGGTCLVSQRAAAGAAIGVFFRAPLKRCVSRHSVSSSLRGKSRSSGSSTRSITRNSRVDGIRGARSGSGSEGSNSGSISRLSRRSGSKICDTNAIIGRDGAVDDGKSDDVSDDPFLGNLEEWDTWEFGSWKTGTHAEHMAEAEARATEPASLPALVGGGAGLIEQTDAELDRAIRVLRVYLTEDRISRMEDVLDQRTKSATIVFENPCNPNNVWACLRTMDSFGVQHAHIVSDPSTYNKKARLKTMCAAMGSQKWLTLHGHNSPEDAVAKLKVEGYQVVASDLSPSAVPIGEIDWSVPTAVVVGNEERGISDSMRDLADATFMIPMRGFVRSFNMSVACSIILAHLSAVRALRHGDLPEHERRRVTATWYMQSVKGSDRILRREGIVVPQSVYRPKGDRSQTVAGYHVR